MESSYQYFRGFRAAADAVTRGWAWRAWRDEETGHPCMVQALMDAIGVVRPNDLPMGVQLELDRQLKMDRSYCVSRKARRERRTDIKTNQPIWRYAVRWNDVEGRTQQEVAAVLYAVADRLEIAYAMHLEGLASQTRVNVSWAEVERGLEDLWDELESEQLALVAT